MEKTHDMAGEMPFIGLISDTHGAVPGCIPELFHGADRILHAGDLGSPDVLSDLEALAPVVAVRGNVDALGSSLPARAVTEFRSLRIGVLHDAGQDGVHAWRFVRAARLDVVVCGHSHRYGFRTAPERAHDAALVNPGAAGAPRFGLPRTAARLLVAKNVCTVEWHDVTLRPSLLDVESWPIPRRSSASSAQE
jgi:putative phosphoesterase